MQSFEGIKLAQYQSFKISQFHPNILLLLLMASRHCLGVCFAPQHVLTLASALAAASSCLCLFVFLSFCLFVFLSLHFPLFWQQPPPGINSEDRCGSTQTLWQSVTRAGTIQHHFWSQPTTMPLLRHSTILHQLLFMIVASVVEAMRMYCTKTLVH